MLDPSIYKVTAMGFWLPCGWANFFDPDEDWHLRDTCSLASVDLKQRSRGRIRIEETLEASVSRRLVTVLRTKGYSHAFWLQQFSEQGSDYTNEPDSKAILLICDMENKHTYPDGWPGNVNIEGLVLIVNDNGFYLWLAIYKSISEEDVKDALRNYIAKLVGDEYFSRFSGKDIANIEHYVTPCEREPSLLQYREEHLGILNFFQLNLVFEGMFNSTFEPEVFFSQDFQSPSVEEIKKKYSLGEFASLILASDLLNDENRSEDQESWIVEDFDRLLDQCRGIDPQTRENPLARQLYNQCMSERTCSDILHQFLRSTSTRTLRTLKWDIECCRRTLLTDMISIMHRRQPLLQAESPDDDTGHITGANEAQIRGYVMLIAAKLPLITNIQRYLNSTVDTLSDQFSTRTLSSLLTAWNGLIDAISDNVHGLERAIEQARMDRLLYEEEQVRAEQETMSEMERIRERSAVTFSETDSLAIDVAANLIAIVALSIAIISPGLSLWEKIIHFVMAPPSSRIILASLTVIGIGLVLYVAVVILFQLVIGIVIQWFRVLRYRWFQQGHRYYYQMDMRLDAPIHADQAEKLFRADFDKSPRPWREKLRWWTKFPREGEQRLPIFTQPERNSCRIERMNEDEALHKVHIETDILWPRKHLWWLPLKSVQKMRCFLTYELLFHRPSKADNYMLRGLRFVSTHSKILSSEHLGILKKLIIKEFINCWLERNYQLSTNPKEEPLLGLTMANTATGKNRPEARIKRLLSIFRWRRKMTQTV